LNEKENRAIHKEGWGEDRENLIGVIQRRKRSTKRKDKE
jgi:hypothetical protein